MERQIQLEEGGFVVHHKDVVRDHDQLLERLVTTLPLKQESLRIFGKDVQTPRLTSWHGDPHCSYRYSGRRFEPHPWTPELNALRERVSDLGKTQFNSVLVNLYRDGNDAMGAHSDNEPELGPRRQDIRIASVSLGSPRRFILTPKRKNHAPLHFMLGHGDVLLMGGTTQQHYKHALPRMKNAEGPRLNLTFRVVKVSPPDAV